MNEVEAQEETIQFVESDLDYDSEYSSSDSGGTDGEVPDVADNTSSVRLSTGSLPGPGRAQSRIATTRIPRNSTIANISVKEGPFTGAWKPVIDGKIQVGVDALTKFRTLPMQASSAGNSSQKQSGSDKASPSPPATGTSEPKKDGNESDSDVRRVPEMCGKSGASGATSSQAQGQLAGPRPRKRGGASADKEHKRLKRLLRNRVSAQQARERKKAYLSDLEVRSKELEQRNAELEEKVSTLQRENYMLRQIVKNTALKKNGSGVVGTTGLEM